MIFSRENFSMAKEVLDWAVSHGTKVSSNVSFRESEPGNVGGYYSEKTEEIEGLEGKQIRLPHKLIIGLNTAINRFKQIHPEGDYEAINTKTTNINSLSKLYLAFERAQNSQTGLFDVYVKSLPNLATINSPYTWDEQNKGYIKGTNLGNSLKENMALLVEEWWQVINLLPETFPKPEEHFVNMKFYYEFKFYKEQELHDYFSSQSSANWTNFTSYLWASLILKSRSFPAYLVDKSCKVDQAMLLPIVDLLNHNPKADVEWSSDSTYFNFKSNSLSPGELFNNYGRKGNEELLLAYGFCLENNESDSSALKIKLPVEILPDLEAKGVQLPKVEDYTTSVIRNTDKPESNYTQYEDGVLFFITKDNLPDSLLLLFQHLMKNPWEDKLTLRMELAGLNKLRQAIDAKVSIINQIPKAQGVNARNINIYVNGQKQILQAAIKGLKRVEKEILVQYKPKLISLKNVYQKDKPFADAMLISLGVTSFQQVVDNNFQDQSWLLYLIRCHNRKEYETESENYLPEWIYRAFERVAREHTVTSEEILQFQELYENLVLPIVEAAPEVFNRGVWTVEELVWSARLLDTISFVRGRDQECILVETD